MLCGFTHCILWCRKLDVITHYKVSASNKNYNFKSTSCTSLPTSTHKSLSASKNYTNLFSTKWCKTDQSLRYSRIFFVRFSHQKQIEISLQQFFWFDSTFNRAIETFCRAAVVTKTGAVKLNSNILQKYMVAFSTDKRNNKGNDILSCLQHISMTSVYTLIRHLNIILLFNNKDTVFIYVHRINVTLQQFVKHIRT